MSRNDPPYTTRPLSPSSADAVANFGAGQGRLSRKEAKDLASYQENIKLLLRAELKVDLEKHEVLIANETDFEALELAKLKRYIEIAQDKFFQDLKDGQVSNINDAGKFNLYPSQTEPKTKTGVTSYFCFSPYRMAKKESGKITYAQYLVANLFVNASLQNILTNLNKEKGGNFSFIELPTKESLIGAADPVGFARDPIIIVGDNIIKFSQQPQPNPVVSVLEADLSAACGLEKLDGPDVKTIPHFVDGGDVVADEKNKVIYINKYSHQFLEGIFIKEVGDKNDIKKEDLEQRNEELKKWFKENLDYEAIFIELDLENIKKKSRLDEIYHLDCFFNVVGKYVVLPEVGILTPACEEMIKARFGEENIIRLTEKERINGGANFIVFDDTIVFGRPGPYSESLAAKFSAKGFDVVVSKFPICANPAIDAEFGLEEQRLFETEDEYKKVSPLSLEGPRCRFNKSPALLLQQNKVINPSANPSVSGASAAEGSPEIDRKSVYTA